MINSSGINNVASLLQQIEDYKSQIRSVRENGVHETKPAKQDVDFGKLTASALESVHKAQNASKALKEAYEQGSDVPLTEVVLSMQKSSLAFEATLQVRNKVLKAYEDILNMPV